MFSLFSSRLSQPARGMLWGLPLFFLQMSFERARSRRLLVLRQRLVEQLVQAGGLCDAWPKPIPIIPGLYNDPPRAAITDPATLAQYKSLVSALQHLSNYTRPDTSFAVSYHARFMCTPITRVKDLICYWKVTSSYGLYLGGSSQHCPLHAYWDSDYANCSETRRSVTGLAFKCGVGSISWKSAKQATVSRSTVEAEYVAAGEVAKEVQ
jgi:hypothetical protein